MRSKPLRKKNKKREKSKPSVSDYCSCTYTMNLSPIPSTPSFPPNSKGANTQFLLIVLTILVVICVVLMIWIVFDFIQECNIYQQEHRQEVPELEMREIVGVDPHLRDNIPNFVYQPGISGTVPFEERKCAWCQEEFTNGDRLSSIPSCGHVFHSDCIGEYMLRRNTCPFCRQPIALPAVQDWIFNCSIFLDLDYHHHLGFSVCEYS